MSEEPLSAIQAARAIREVGRWSGQLRQRTIGLTWMLWGIVTPAIFVTYAWSEAALAAGRWAGILWLPWSVLGVSFTLFLWSSAHVERTEPALSQRELVVHVALFLVATVGAGIVVIAFGIALAAPIAVLLGLGLLVGMLGARESFGGARAIGALQVAGGLVLTALGLQLAVLEIASGTAAMWGAIASAAVLSGIGAFRFGRS